MSQRRGFTLVELLCVIALIGVIGLILTQLLRATLDTERTQTASFDQILQRNAIADQFRADVGHAEKAVDEFGAFTSDADTLILQLSKDSHIVYRWEKRELVRRAFDGNKETKRAFPLDGTQVAVDFVRDEAEPRLIRLRLKAMRQGKAVAGRTTEIDAALGGDAR